MWRTRFLVVVGLALGAGAPALAEEPLPSSNANAAQPQAQPADDDAAITAVIEAKLQQRPLLHNAHITVSTTRGVVTLSGTVLTNFAREQAIAIVHSTAGVVLFDNQLRLDISSPAAPTYN